MRRSAAFALVVSLSSCLALSSSSRAETLVPLRDAATPLREALAAGDVARAQELLPLAVDAPGLRARVLRARGDGAGSCRVVERDAADAASPSRDAARIEWARCLDDRGDAASIVRAQQIWSDVSRGPFASEPRVLAEIAAFVRRRHVAVGTLLHGALATVAVPGDLQRRRALGDALLLLAEQGSEPDRGAALVRLLDDLVETDAHKVASQGPQARARVQDDPKAAALTRAAVLEKLQQNDDVVRELSAYHDDCDAGLLLGKAYRKLRKYGASRAALATATAKGCPDDTRKRAQYLEAKVAALTHTPRATALLETFARTWGDADPLVDDALFWLGEEHARGADEDHDAAKAAAHRDAARTAWQRVLDAQPDGDMADEARFRLAMGAARAGATDDALRMLDDALRAAQQRPRPRIDVLARAGFWRARLALCPDPTSLAVTTNGARRAEGTSGLQALALQRDAGWYGRLARVVLRQLHIDAPPAPSVARTGLPDDARVRASAALADDARFALAQSFITRGYDDEAIWLLDAFALAPNAVATSGLPHEDAFALAATYARAGAPDRSHRVLRAWGFALLDGTPAGQGLASWTLAWPRAHAAAIEAAAREQKIPSTLLMGLAREESAFDATIVSWAGAAGLCQLMPGTAADEAKALHLPAPDVEALRDPVLNARLGAAHIARRLRAMRNPVFAIAAYNAGPGMVKQWLPKAGTSMPVDAWVESIPVEETRNYVKKVTGSWASYATLDGPADGGLDAVTFPAFVAGG